MWKGFFAQKEEESRAQFALHIRRPIKQTSLQYLTSLCRFLAYIALHSTYPSRRLNTMLEHPNLIRLMIMDFIITHVSKNLSLSYGLHQISLQDLLTFTDLQLR